MTSKKIINERAVRYAQIMEAAKAVEQPFTSYCIAEKSGLSVSTISCLLVAAVKKNHLIKAGETFKAIKGNRRPLYRLFDPSLDQKKQPGKKPSKPKRAKPHQAITKSDMAWMRYWALPRSERRRTSPPMLEG